MCINMTTDSVSAVIMISADSDGDFQIEWGSEPHDAFIDFDENDVAKAIVFKILNNMIASIEMERPEKSVH